MSKKHKEDKSPKVPQREKLKDSLNIRELKWTPKQLEFIEKALRKETNVMLLRGPAGCAKTLLSVYAALKMIAAKRVSDLIYIRSAVESSDAKLGFLPGDADEKLAFYNVPLLDKLNELLPKAEIDRLLNEERVNTYPINFARGLSWNAKVVIFDEAQNSSVKEIVTVLTRLGKFTKCFILADPEQTDLPKGKGGGFDTLFNVFNDDESKAQGVETFEFTEEDIMRSDLVRFIVKKVKGVK